MDTDILIDDEDLVDQLTKEYQSSLLNAADASPSEILADVASILVAPISPALGFQLSPIESSNSDSGSDDDSKILSPSERQSSQSPFDWLSTFDSEPTNYLKPEDVDLFIQKSDPISTNTNIPANKLIPNARLPQRTGPVMAIENGVIKGIKIENKDNVEDTFKINGNLSYNSLSNGNNLQKSYFNVVNENFQHNTVKKEEGSVHLVLEQKKVPTILKRSTNLLFHEPQRLVIPAESTKGTKITIMPINQNNLQKDTDVSSYQFKASPPRSIFVNPKVESPEYTGSSPQNTVPLNIEDVMGPMLDYSEYTDAEKRAIKKQQRMIKNRETACRSRQKKKEHLAELENKLLQAQQEIYRLQHENKQLREQLERNGKSRKIPRLNTPFIVPKKNIAVIFAMVFMVSINWNFIGWNSKPFVGPSKPHYGSRHLLWDQDAKDTSSAEMDQFVNRSSDSIDCKNATLNANNFLHINQTESIRIAGDLNRWIGNGKTLNWTNSSKKKQPVYVNEEKINGGLLETYKLFNKLNFDNNIVEIPTFSKNNGKNVRDKSRQRRLRRTMQMEKDVDFADDTVYYKTLYRKPMRKPMNNFDIDDLSEWNDLLRALERRDDTFYVVGVGKGEHLLLPAVSHNITRPPRMALILPARSGNDSQMNDHVTLMQIDCSVVNTTLVKLKSEALPESLRKPTHDIRTKEYGNHKSENNTNNNDVIDASLPTISPNVKSNESNVMYPDKKENKPGNVRLNKKDIFGPYITSKIEQSKKITH